MSHLVPEFIDQHRNGKVIRRRKPPSVCDPYAEEIERALTTTDENVVAIAKRLGLTWTAVNSWASRRGILRITPRGRPRKVR